MVYDYTCSDCGYTFEEAGVRMDERDAPRTCPSCGGEAPRDLAATLRGSRVAYRPDLTTVMEQKFGGCPTWHPPKDSGGRTSRPGRPGVVRHYPGDPKHERKWT